MSKVLLLRQEDDKFKASLGYKVSAGACASNFDCDSEKSGAGAMAQQVRALADLPVDLEVQFPVPVSALALTPVPGELASSSGLYGYLTYVTYTDVHAHIAFFFLRGLGIQFSDRGCAGTHRALSSVPTAVVVRQACRHIVAQIIIHK